MHASLDGLESCDFSERGLLADSTQGGGCESEADLECMASAEPFVLTLEPHHIGWLYLSSSKENHCTNGQRLVVQVHRAPHAPPPPPPEVIIGGVRGPWWTDDAGYCKPIPSMVDGDTPDGIGVGAHHKGLRRHGMAPISITVDQTLVLKYSNHHDVWSHPSLEALESCDYTGAVRLANTSQGSGCHDDEDLVCIADANGWRLTPAPEQAGTSMYLSCAVGDHCRNGQRIVIHLEPASSSGSSSSSSTVSLQTGLPLVALGMLLVLLPLLLWCVLQRFCGKGSKRNAGSSELAMGSRPGSSDDPAHASAPRNAV